MDLKQVFPDVYRDAEPLDCAPLFNLLDTNNNGRVPVDALFRYLRHEGILKDDLRLHKLIEAFEDRHHISSLGTLKLEEFEHYINQNSLVKNALTKNLIIPDFDDFRQDIEEIYHKTRENTKGDIATYIPQLARVNPDQFAVSICTIDGQRYSWGDAYTNFCLQSTCKPVNYCLSLKDLGEEEVHHHVGREPSGRSFNELSLNDENLPHNPLINAGAIMCCSLIKQHMAMADRFDYVFNTWRRLCAYKSVAFNNAVYLSERQTADRNFALAYFMRENGAFPEGVNLIETLEFYLQCCAIESCTHNLAIAAATFANAGVNPLTGEKIFDDKFVQHSLSLMLSCGMYDFSGEFAFKIGLPAKSGVSGGLMLVVPNLMGISIWSPRLDEHGNSVRGVEFCERLIEKYSFHNYDSLTRETSKKNPRKRKYEVRVNQVTNLIYAASHGDLEEVKRLEALGVDISSADYDGRTALHLAAAENQLDVVKYLVARNVPTEVEDRWGGTPKDDARRGGHEQIIAILEGKFEEE